MFRNPKYLEWFGVITAITYSMLVAMNVGAEFVGFTLLFVSAIAIGLWAYAKFDLAVDYLVQRWGWTWLQQPKDAWRKKYPHVTKKIDELESRIKKLEGKKCISQK